MDDGNVVDLGERREKKPATQAQLDALARGRATRAANLAAGIRPGKKKSRAERSEQNKGTHKMATDALERLHTLDHAAIDVLEGLLYDEDPKVRLQTAKLLVEHRVGRPTQKVEAENTTKIVYEVDYVGEDREVV